MKLLKSLVLIPLLLVLISTNVFAETIYTEGALNYVIRDGSIVIINYFGDSANVKVPDHIGGYIVTGIASNALTKECIEKVELPETITNIEEGAIIEHSKVAVVDSYGNTVTEEIEDITVDEDFYVSSEEYDELEELEFVDVDGEDVFEENDSKEENKEDTTEEFEEIYSAKVSEEVSNNNNNTYILIVIGIIVVFGVVFYIYKRKTNNK